MLSPRRWASADRPWSAPWPHPPSEDVLNTGQIPLGERAQREILEHIQKIGDEAESTYLEIKSHLDFSAKRDIAKVAKFLLGAANRTVDEAKRHFGGYAVLVIGAARGQSPGIPRGTEAHELEDKVRPYVGPDLPSFEMGRLPVDERNEVLFVFMPPPILGQPLFPCHKDFQGDKKQDNLDDGAVYVRGASNTRPARAPELLALVRRAKGANKPVIDLDFEVTGNIRHVSRLREVLETLYADEEEKYLKIGKEVGGGFETIIGRAMTRAAEEQRRGQFAAAWRAEMNENISEGGDHLLGATLEAVILKVTSVDRFIAKPHLSVTFRDCRFVEYVNQRRASFKKVVKPVPNSHFDSLSVPIVDAASYSLMPKDYPVSWVNSDTDAVLRLAPDAFRPNAAWPTEDEDFVVVASDPECTSVTATWSLTEDASDVVSTGSFSVDVAPPIDAWELVRHLAGDEL